MSKTEAQLLTPFITYTCEFCGKAIPITEIMFRMFLHFEPTESKERSLGLIYLVCKDCENEIILMLEKMRKEKLNIK